MPLIIHTKRAPRLFRYVDSTADTDPHTVAEVELHPNSGLAICAGGDKNFNLLVSQLDPIDNVVFDTKTYAVVAGTSKTVYHRGAAGACRIQIVKTGSGTLVPDVRGYGMSQP